MSRSRKIIILIEIAVISFLGYFWYVRNYQSLPQDSINIIPIITSPKQDDKILIFSPHPDDETIATGGFIKAATEAHADVHIVLVTDGNKHHLEKVRYSEFAIVTKFLGVPEQNLIYLNYPDGEMKKQNMASVEAKFKKIFLDINPNIVFIPSTDDHHMDHKITGEIADRMIKESGQKPQIYYYLVHYPRFPLPEGFNTNLYVLPPLRLISFSKGWVSFPLTPELEKAKKTALLNYKTQLRFPPLKYLIEGFIRKNELFMVSN